MPCFQQTTETSCANIIAFNCISIHNAFESITLIIIIRFIMNHHDFRQQQQFQRLHQQTLLHTSLFTSIYDYIVQL